MLTHVRTNCGVIAPTELSANYGRMQQPYHPNTHIGDLHKQIKDAVAYAYEGNQPYMASPNWSTSLTYCASLHDYIKIPSRDGKQWANFKIQFSRQFGVVTFCCFWSVFQ
jgi:hypothetical protein